MLKLQYFGHLTQIFDSLEKTLMLGKIEGKRRRGWQRMNWLDSITYSMDMNLSKLWEIVKDREPWCVQSTGSQRVRHDLASEQQQIKWMYFSTNPTSSSFSSFLPFLWGRDCYLYFRLLGILSFFRNFPGSHQVFFFFLSHEIQLYLHNVGFMSSYYYFTGSTKTSLLPVKGKRQRRKEEEATALKIKTGITF